MDSSTRCTASQLKTIQDFANAADYVYIYALVDPFTKGVCYVGKAECPKCRLYNHLKASMQQLEFHLPKAEWIRDLIKNDALPELKILERCHKLVENEREHYWIDYYIRHGARLMNINHFTNLSYKQNSEMKSVYKPQRAVLKDAYNSVFNSNDESK